MMDLDVDTPFLDSLQSGEMPRQTRVLAARAGLATNPLEQLAVLVLLSDDPDTEVSTLARGTVDAIPPDSLSVFLARPDVPEFIHAHFRARGTAPDSSAAPTDDAETARADDDDPETTVKEDSGKVVIATLSVMERVKLAMRGTREQRGVLVRDPNKMVCTAVMGSPKLTEAEVEGIAKMTNVSEDVLRIIGNNRGWLRNYTVVANLVKNPKSPVGLSLRMLSRLNGRDIKGLARDRNVPEAIRQGAKKLAAKQEKGD